MTVPIIASIGFGAMARSLAASLASRPGGLRISGTLLPAGLEANLPDGVVRWSTIDELIAARPDLVVECATHQAVHENVPQLLAAGIDTVIVSIGALASPDALERVEDAARTGGGRAILISGAIGGLDVLRAARLDGLEHVTYVGRKPPVAWAGTPAEDLLELSSLTVPATFFKGSASEAARLYPKNANVTAAVALAGVGFKDTIVHLVADPAATGNTHELEACGAFGSFRIILNNTPLPDNPKTSWLAVLSLEQAVIRHFSSVET